MVCYLILGKMATKKFLIGIIAGGIIVAAIIAILMNSSTELTSENVTNVVNEDIETGDPTKITKFFVREQGKTMVMSVIADGKIPYDGKKLPISESAKVFGYAWLRLEQSQDMFHHLPDQLTGYMASIKPGDDGSSPERWWNVELVNILQMDPDDPKFCLLYSKKTGGVISVEENELRIEMISSKDISILPPDRAMVIEIIDEQACLTQKGVQILDIRLK